MLQHRSSRQRYPVELSIVAFFDSDDVNRTGSDFFEVFEHKILLCLVTAGGVEVVVLHLLISFLIGPALVGTVYRPHIARPVAPTGAVKVKLTRGGVLERSPEQLDRSLRRNGLVLNGDVDVPQPSRLCHLS